MILNNYEISTFVLFVVMIVFLFYITQVCLFVVYHYKPKIDNLLNEKLNLKFDDKIKTNNTIPFFLRDTIITILLIPVIIIIIILFFDYKLIRKILNKTIKLITFELILETTSMALFYFIIFYSSNYLVIEF